MARRAPRPRPWLGPGAVLLAACNTVAGIGEPVLEEPDSGLALDAAARLPDGSPAAADAGTSDADDSGGG